MGQCSLSSHFVFNSVYVIRSPVPVAARSKEWVYGRSIAGIAGSNPARGMDFCILWGLRFVRKRFLLRAHHWSRGTLRNVVFITNYDLENFDKEEA
jgi:hypothetical protein